MKEGSLLEFKILVKKLLKGLSENFNKEIVSIKCNKKEQVRKEE